MPAKLLRICEVLVILLVLAAIGWIVRKKIPPYERGIHGSVAKSLTNPGPWIDSCPIFPADNVWNTPIDTLRKDQLAETFVDSIGPRKRVHPDFGGNLNNGLAFTEIAPGTRPSPVTFDYKDDSDQVDYPIPEDAPVEGGPSAKGDRHMLLIDPRGCILYELYAAYPQADGSWIAGSGIRMDLNSNALRGAGKTSADAAGLPMLPGLVRYEEVAAGEIKHALRFTIPHTRNAFIWPARHQASNKREMKYPPMGTRFRLRADFDTAKYSRSNQVIMIALKRYGMFLADNGGAMYLSGVPDKRWNDNDLRKLNAMRTEDFEAVDESGLQVSPDSAQVNLLGANR